MHDEMFEEVDELEDDCCPDCGRPLITAPDKTVACSWCGLVIGQGYSLYFGGPGGSVKDPEEDEEWNGATDDVECSFERRVAIVGWATTTY